MSGSANVLDKNHDYDWEELNRIIAFARQLQQRYNGLPSLEERKGHIEALINICRRYSDGKCANDCEVKKAYDIIVS